MSLQSVVRHISRSTIAEELIEKLKAAGGLSLRGATRLPKSLIASATGQKINHNLLVVCATLEEAARWAACLELMGWKQVFFYPTSSATFYETFTPESEMVWGQLQTLASLVAENTPTPWAMVTTEMGLQPHLPPPFIFKKYCLQLVKGMTVEIGEIGRILTSLGYERTTMVEREGQWAVRGNLVDIFPVSAELPLRLEWFGDQLEEIREFEPSSQRSLDSIEQFTITPVHWEPIIAQHLPLSNALKPYLTAEEWEKLETCDTPDYTKVLRTPLTRFLGVAFGEKVADILDYLPSNTILAIDELDHCIAHSSVWLDQAEKDWQLANDLLVDKNTTIPKIHRSFSESLNKSRHLKIFLSELAVSSPNVPPLPTFDISTRALPVSPHQIAKIAEFLRGKREIDDNINLGKYNNWLISAQPSRTVSLIREHDCPAQFVANPLDFGTIDSLQRQGVCVALKYSGSAELEGFILPTFRLAVITDREIYGQHSLATPTYIRKKRRAASRQVDLDKLKPNDYVVHKYHGIGQFLGLETFEGREYLVIRYADGLLRVPADSLDLVSRYRSLEAKPPQLHKMSGREWQNTKNRVKKSLKKLAFDLVKLYSTRSQQRKTPCPPDTPWQVELEESFPYQPTPDQLKAIQEVKRDLESDRPMDRLICGDVGFGKTEVAIRAIFKVVTAANKQVVFLAPTTILSQQHYQTLVERFAPYPINVGLLNRFRSPAERKEIIQKLATGELDVVVGTHLLLSDKIKFKNLGLLVIDEEQRFGVNHKEKIKAMKTEVDVLTLSATPIPRTLYMSLSGVRDMSLILTPPPNRRPIKTQILPFHPEVVRTAIRNELDRGGQIFYVVPRIEDIEKTAAMLLEMLPSLRIAIAHGQMEEGQLESTMLAFNNGEADLLLCTTIIESGLDIPRVNTIIIESAHRFGLAQLYQLRGRVGRTGIQAYAWLLYPNEETLSDTARMRIFALQEFSQLGSGYHLAMRDMEIRGVGNLFGAEQSGHMQAIGFELYTEMLREAINEVQGQEIPMVEDTQIDLKLTALIPNSYIPDLEQKMSAYRAITSVTSQREIKQIEAEWRDRYGPIPEVAKQLLEVAQLKLKAKSLGFSRIKPEGKQNVVLETPMQEPAWQKLAERLPAHLRSRFVYAKNKVVVKGLGALKPSEQLKTLNLWFDYLQSDSGN